MTNLSQPQPIELLGEKVALIFRCVRVARTGLSSAATALKAQVLRLVPRRTRPNYRFRSLAASSQFHRTRSN